MSATSRNEAVHRVKLQSPAATDESWRVHHVVDEPIQLQQYTSCASPSSPFCVPHALTFTPIQTRPMPPTTTPSYSRCGRCDDTSRDLAAAVARMASGFCSQQYRGPPPWLLRGVAPRAAGDEPQTKLEATQPTMRSWGSMLLQVGLESPRRLPSRPDTRGERK